jgi:hypothetical protein
MSYLRVLLGAVALVAGLPLARGQQVHVDDVQGQVLYGAGAAVPRILIKAGQTLGPGTFCACTSGTLSLSAAPGSVLRLNEMGTLRFLGEIPCATGPMPGTQSRFQLEQGKLTVMIREPGNPPHCYRVDLHRGSLLMETGLCVMCMHGDGSYVFLARGRASLQSTTTAAKTAVMSLSGNGKVGVLANDGEVEVRPLWTVASATQNCLLAGFKPDGAGGSLGGSHPVDANAAIVSPIQ